MTTLTPERLSELRRVAEAATPGEWRRGLWPNTFTINCLRYDICTIHDDADGRPLIGPEIALCAEEDAEYIAAFDPPTCLALLAALAEAQHRADSLLEEHDYFLEETEKYGQLVARIIKALGKEWREETDDDAQTIALGAISDLLSERDAAQQRAERESQKCEAEHE